MLKLSPVKQELSCSHKQRVLNVVGAGLSGCECALSLARRGQKLRLFEMRPHKRSEAHKTDLPAELVCSNSFKSEREDSAAGQLKRELKTMGSTLFEYLDLARVPAGGALAVDRKQFSLLVDAALKAEPNIEIVHEEICELDPEQDWIICAGPLASEALLNSLQKILGSEYLNFYDAAAPIVEAESLNMDKLFAESRHGKGGADYLNAPFSKDEYDRFYDELLCAEKTLLKEFEKGELFSACQPLEEIARTGRDALRYGALKPVGLTDPQTGRRPWAVVQLRDENAERSAYNLVGFQTNLKFSEQKRIFSMIPGLEQAEFSRYGVMHKNSFINAPKLLDESFALIDKPWLRFAGQISGTEGYTEAIASGLYAALNYLCYVDNREAFVLPRETVFGALLHYASSQETQDYQPMHVNFGIMPPFEQRIKNKAQRYQAYVDRAQAALECYLMSRKDLFVAEEL